MFFHGGEKAKPLLPLAAWDLWLVSGALVGGWNGWMCQPKLGVLGGPGPSWKAFSWTEFD